VRVQPKGLKGVQLSKNRSAVKEKAETEEAFKDPKEEGEEGLK
jgi:hypothetical protein